MNLLPRIITIPLTVLLCIFIINTPYLSAAPPQLAVSGNHFVNAATGCPVRLAGVNVDGLEWEADGAGLASPSGDMTQSLTVAVNTWKSNIIRIPLNQDFWFGYSNGVTSSSATQNIALQNDYRAYVANMVNTASALNCYVILDLHWSGMASWGTSTSVQALGPAMPDMNALVFWQSLAAAFGNNPAVLFGLYNEPTYVSWSVWRDGGWSGSFISPGYQTMLETIRDTGAKNIVIAAGLVWCHDLTGIPANALADQNTGNTLTGYGIAYDAHVYYGNPGNNDAASWDQYISVAVNAGYCVIVGEFGSQMGGANSEGNCCGWDDSGCNPFESSLIAWLDGGNNANYLYNATAWDLNPYSGPVLIKDWTYAPTSCHGADVFAWLNGITQPPCLTPSPTITGTVPTPTITYTSTPQPVPNSVNADCSQGASFIIDGNLNDPAWQTGTWTAVTRVTSGIAGAVSARFKLRWDTTALYVAVDVTDPVLCNSNVNWWDDDDVEIYIDANNNHSTTYEADDFEFSKRYNDPITHEAHGKLGGVTAATYQTASGYSVEFRMPWTDLGVTPSSSLVMGFDVGIDHNETCGPLPDGVFMWNGTGNNYLDTSAFGEAYFSACVNTPTSTMTVTPAATGTKTPAPTPCAILTPSGPIVINGQNGATIQNLYKSTSTGDGIQITNSTNITIENCEIGPVGGNAIRISGSSGNINVYDNYIHSENLSPGCCDNNDGIFITGASNVDIQGNVIAYGESNIEVQQSNTITVTGNFLLNPRGPFPRGQNFQAWGNCANILFQGNYCLSSQDTGKYTYPEGQEDSVNFGFTNGVIARNNYITGGHSASGTGIIADEAANNVQFLDNILVDTGQCGIGLASGSTQLVDGNIIVNRTPINGAGNAGLYVWSQYADPCGPVTISNNLVYQINWAGNPNDYWNGGGCGTVTLTNNTFYATAPTPVTPPLIPPQPKNCAVLSPYTTQTLWLSCCSLATPSQTAVNTLSKTPTITSTMTVTYTRTLQATLTYTQTQQASATQTAIPTATCTPARPPQPDKLQLTESRPFPNPICPSSQNSLGMIFNITRDCDTIKFRLYTVGFRLIKESVFTGSYYAGDNTIAVNTGEIKNLASGIYYYVLIASGAGNKPSAGKAGELIVLREK